MKNSPAPLVSVVIATHNRADLLLQSVSSVLNQTFQDFELLLVDDGSTDNTREVISSISDPRVRYLSTEPGRRGISAARNAGADAARGIWTAVHDDDDLMLPWRLERQLAFAHPEDDFVFGTFINFDDANGSLQFHHGREFDFGSAIRTGFAPGHSTWLIKTELLRHFRYDEGLESAVDNNLAFRLLRSGIVARHSGVVCLLRRVHSGRITNKGAGNQKYAARLNLDFLKSGINSKSQQKLWQDARYMWGPTDKEDWETRYLPYLPDHLVKRGGVAIVPSGKPGDYSLVEGSQLSWDDVYRLAGDGAFTDALTARYAEAPRAEKFLPRGDSGSEIEAMRNNIEKFVISKIPPGSHSAVAILTASGPALPSDIAALCDQCFIFTTGKETFTSGYAICDAPGRAEMLTDQVYSKQESLSLAILSNSPAGGFSPRSDDQ